MDMTGGLQHLEGARLIRLGDENDRSGIALAVPDDRLRNLFRQHADVARILQSAA
jgi:hypothetical protein